MSKTKFNIFLGPLVVNNGKWTQVGIVSWGIGCGKGQYPGVNNKKKINLFNIDKYYFRSILE